MAAKVIATTDGSPLTGTVHAVALEQEWTGGDAIVVATLLRNPYAEEDGGEWEVMDDGGGSQYFTDYGNALLFLNRFAACL
jgi:hypothetical protein